MSEASVLITGANGGIGAALVEAFAQAGWRVVATSQSPASAKSKAYATIQADLADLVADEEAISDFAKEVIGAAGDKPLAALVNNAALQVLAPLKDLESADILRTMSVNVIAPFLLTKAFLPQLEASEGCVVNIGSVHAQSTKPEFSAYATSKAALHGLTRALAVDLGPKVRVNTLAPAATATPMLMAGFKGKGDKFKQLEACHPLNRIATTEEIAKIAVFLASKDAAFITGATLYADGGVLSRLHDPV
jgi:NAD(P)-dependent dehydrogenase (short-subunit alcohol dehydrogenase family)